MKSPVPEGTVVTIGSIVGKVATEAVILQICVVFDLKRNHLVDLVQYEDIPVVEHAREHTSRDKSSKHGILSL